MFLQYEPAIQQGNEPFVYRMILYQCHVKDQVLVNNRFDCTDGGSSAIKACTNIIATWSMGAEVYVCSTKAYVTLGHNNINIILITSNCVGSPT